MATPRICSIPGCGKRHVGRGWCSSHYERWRTHGGPCLGAVKTPNGEPRNYFENVVLAHDDDTCLIWPYARTSAGYGHMLHNGKTQLVSRLVCAEVNGPAPTPKHEAAHSCGRGHEGCCAKRHLSWKLPVENAADRIGHGTQPRSDLTEAQIREIRALKGTMSQSRIGAMFGVDQTTVSKIQLGQTWAWVA